MITNLWQRFDDSFPPTAGGEGISHRLQSQGSPPVPADFTERHIELFMLPHPENPSAYLETIYAAIRNQMDRDGCA